MLVVTANWAIADGTVHGGPPQSAAREFFREVRRAAWRSGFRQDGRYRPVDAIHIVLAGDTFDGLASLAWHGDLRPWQGGPRARAAADRVAAKAAQRGSRLLAGLGRLQRDGLAVPQADGRGRPMPGTTCQTAVNVACLLGDRDRVLDGHWFAAIAARHGVAIGTEWSSDGVVVRHGSECDPLCGPPDLPAHGRGPTLAESLVVDLLVDFAWRLQGASLSRAAAVPIIRQLAVAPPLHMPDILAGHHEPAIRAAWQRSVHHWHSRTHATTPEFAAQHDAVDALATWLEMGGDRDAPEPRASLTAAIDGLRPHLSRRRSDMRLFVLGHPPGTMSADTAAGGTGVLCLGPTEPSAATMPATIAFPAAGSRHGVWLTDARRETDRRRTIHVAPTRLTNDEPGIVDAA